MIALIYCLSLAAQEQAGRGVPQLEFLAEARRQLGGPAWDSVPRHAQAELLESIAVAQARMGACADAESTATLIRESEAPRRALALTAVADSCAGKPGADQVARRALREARRLAERDSSHAGLSPLLSKIARAEARIGDIPAAQTTARDALAAASLLPAYDRHRGTASCRPVALFEVAEVWDALGRPREAAEAREQGMASIRMIASTSDRSRVLLSLIAIRADAGDLIACRGLLDQIPANDPSRDAALGRIAAAQASGGDPDGAFATLCTVNNPHVQARFFADHLSRAKLRNGDCREASRQLSRKLTNRAVLAPPLAQIADTLASRGRKTEAREFAEEALANCGRNQAGLLATIGRVFALVGDTTRGRTLIDKAAAEEASSTLPQRSAAYAALAESYAALGDYTKAVRYCSEIDEAHAQDRSQAASAIIRGRLDAGDVDGALKDTGLFPSGTQASASLTEIAADGAKRLVFRGRIDDAVRWANGLEHPAHRAWAFLKIAETMRLSPTGQRTP